MGFELLPIVDGRIQYRLRYYNAKQSNRPTDLIAFFAPQSSESIKNEVPERRLKKVGKCPSLMVTPLAPSLWPFLCRVQLVLDNTAGALQGILEFLRDQQISVVYLEGSPTDRTHGFFNLIIDLARYKHDEFKTCKDNFLKCVNSFRDKVKRKEIEPPWMIGPSTFFDQDAKLKPVLKEYRDSHREYKESIYRLLNGTSTY